MQATAGFGPPHNRPIAGMTTVLASHVVPGWAVLDSLGHRLVGIDLPPLQAEIIEERPPPPPQPSQPLQVPLTMPPPVPAPPPPAPPAPPPARRAEATGTTGIRFQVGADGSVLQAQVLQRSKRTREHWLLDRAAVESLSGCRFSAGSDRQGRPIGG